MIWGALLFIVIVWSAVGFAVAFTAIDSEGFEYVNPVWIYKKYHVNYFGAALICIFYNLICPIGSICYWIYKLCTVGRR